MNIKTYYILCSLIMSLALFSERGCLQFVYMIWAVQLFHFICTCISFKKPNYKEIKNRFERQYYKQCAVSILKPLNGEIPRLEETLESYFQLEWPKFELIFCVANANDPAVDIINKLSEKYPNVSQFVSVGSEDYRNPKLANLQSGYDHANFDLIWVADANVVGSDGALQDMVDKCIAGAALVHQIPWGISGPNVIPEFSALPHGSMLERWYFATSHGRPYTVINNILCTCLNGMSILFQKSSMEKVGGLKYFSENIDEDAKIGLTFDRQGLKTSLSCHAAIQNLDVFSFKQYIERRTRWIRLRNNSEISYAVPFEIMIDSHIFSLVAICILCIVHGYSWLWPILHTSCWLSIDSIIFMLFDRSVCLPKAWQDCASNDYFFDWGHVSDKPQGFVFFGLNMVQHYVMWVVRECIGIYIRIIALQKESTIKWGGSPIQLNNEQKKDI